jgi:transcriptional regulator with XRE-family HTH domain
MAQFEAREIGARIQKARKQRGLTQPDLAELCDVTPRTVQNWEAGTHPPYKHLRTISRLLNRPEEWFLYGEEAQDAAPDEATKAQLDRIEQALETLIAQGGQAEQPETGTADPE